MTPRPWETRAFGECAFPLTIDNTTYSCCDPVSGERSYCEAHCRAMYVPTPPARKHRRKV